MKKLLIASIVALATLGSAAQTPVINAKRINTSIVVNGNLNDSGWEVINNCSKTIVGSPNNVVRFGVMWNSQYLYVGYTITDANLYNDSQAEHEDDGIELYIDADNNGGTTYGINDRQFLKGWNSSTLFEKNNKPSGVLHAWAAIANGYAVELAIPWSNIGITNPAAGLRIGFDVACNDDDNGGTREHQSMWAGDNDNWRYPRNFGDLVLTEPVDSQPPSTPSSLTVAGITQTSITLAWLASTDNVGVTGYDVYRDGTKINTTPVAATTYNMTGLVVNTSYSFYVIARDAAGNSSVSSSTLISTISDLTSPQAPANLTASNITETTLELNWNAATDNVGVAGYDVYQDNVKINMSPVGGTTYNVTGLSPFSAYNYYVRARDAAGNNSNNSNTIQATTLAVLDTELPTVPANLTASDITHSSFILNWLPSTDNIGVAGYDIYINESKINNATVTTTTYRIEGVSETTTYQVYVRAKDEAGNSSQSDVIEVNTPVAPDTQTPSAPAGLAATDITETSLNLSWEAAFDNEGVAGYDIYQNDIKINLLPVTSLAYNISGLSGATAYSYYVKAFDVAGNMSATSNIVNIVTTDIQAPTPPAMLSVSNLTQNSLLLSWTAAIDNLAVAGYDVYMNDIKINTLPVLQTSYTVTGLVVETSYDFYVKAFDEAGNTSTASNTVNAVTPDTESPTAPSGVVVSNVTAVSLTLSWLGSEDNIGVAGYDVYQDDTKINSSPVSGTAFDVTGLFTGVSYNFYIRAIDIAGNVSVNSITVGVTTPDVQLPSAPANLAASAITQSTLSLTWNASSDNAGVTGYDVFMDDVKINAAPVPGTVYNVTGLTVVTTYGFYVRALDAAGNVSGNSNTINVITRDTLAPAAPANLAASAITQSSLLLSWTSASDNVGVTGYDVYRNNVKINEAPVTGNTYDVTGLTAMTSYAFYVRALDAAGNESANSNTINVITPDLQAPSAPANLAASAITQSSLLLTWIPANDNVGVTGYDVYQDNVKINIAPVSGTTYNIAGLTAVTSYTFFVRALDAAGNISVNSNSINILTPDTQAPAVPTSLVSSAVTATTLTLNWTASNDNVEVTGYNIYQNNVRINAVPVTTTTFNVSGLITATAYTFYVRALDAAGNISANSNTVNVTTQDTQAPAAPSGLVSSNVTATTLTLSWVASTDNVSVTGYDVYQNNTKINAAPVTITSYAVTGLTASTAYSFFVRAGDAAGNISPNSNTINVTTMSVSGCIGTGAINFQRWNNVTGVSIANLTSNANYPNNPTTSGTVTSFEIPANGGDNYGMRVYGYICPPVTGSYTFWIASDDNCELWLSTSSNPSGKQRIAYHTQWTLSREWNKYPTQKSAAITLTAGQLYYVEALMKDGSQGDNMAVGWAKPGQPTTAASEVIPGTNMVTQIPTGPDTQAPSPPASLTASNILQTSLSLNWSGATDNTAVTGYDVYRDGIKINTSTITTTSYNMTGLLTATLYSFFIRAKDAAGNISANSTALNVATAALNTGAETFTQRTVIANQRMPHDLVYGPDNNIWYTERFGGRVSFVVPATGVKTTVLTLGSKMVRGGGQDGLMGLALHPQFNSGQPYVYISYTYQSLNSTVRRIRIERYSYNSTTRTLGSPVTVIEDIPGSNDHNSSRLAIGPDLKLYYTAGDMGAGQFENQNRTQNAQNLNVYEGKILRLNTEAINGSWIPTDNPFSNGGLKTAVYSSGHRNPQGLVWGDVNGVDVLYSSEHGPYSDDEINVIERARNYGWPQVAGFCDGNYNGRTIGNFAVVSEQTNCVQLNAKEPIRSIFPAANPPQQGSDNMGWPSTAPSGTEFYGSTAIPGWQNSLLVAMLKKGVITRFKLSSNGQSIISDTINYFRGKGRFRDVVVSADGLKIYVACDSSGSTSGPTGGVTSSPANPGSILEFTYVPTSSLERSSLITQSIPEEDTKDRSIDVYPNPANTFFIVYNHSAGPARTIELIDINGRVVRKQTASHLATRIETGKLNNGLYILKVTDEKGRVIRTEKIIVRK